MTGEFLAKDIAISVFVAWFIVQVLLKTITSSYRKKKFFWKAAFMGGGMPSGHSALVAALSTAVGLSQGFDSAIFLVTLVFSLIVIYEVLLAKRVVADFLSVMAEKHPKKHLLEELGHGIMEVLIGAVIGIVVVIALFYY